MRGCLLGCLWACLRGIQLRRPTRLALKALLLPSNNRNDDRATAPGTSTRRRSPTNCLAQGHQSLSHQKGLLPGCHSSTRPSSRQHLTSNLPTMHIYIYLLYLYLFIFIYLYVPRPARSFCFFPGQSAIWSFQLEFFNSYLSICIHMYIHIFMYEHMSMYSCYVR